MGGGCGNRAGEWPRRGLGGGGGNTSGASVSVCVCGGVQLSLSLITQISLILQTSRCLIETIAQATSLTPDLQNRGGWGVCW